MDWKEAAVCAALVLFPTGWILSSFVDAYKERNRHAEQDSLIAAFVRQAQENEDALAKAIMVFASQKTLIFVRDEQEDIWNVRGVSLMDRDMLNRLVKDEEQASMAKTEEEQP